MPPLSRSVTAMWKPLSMIALPSRFACHTASASAKVWPWPWMQKSMWQVVPPNAAAVWPRRDVVDRDGAAERHVEMRVRVDRTRQHQLAGRIDDDVRVDVERRPDQRDPLALDVDVGNGRIGCGDDAAVPDQHGHRGSSSRERPRVA